MSALNDEEESGDDLPRDDEEGDGDGDGSASTTRRAHTTLTSDSESDADVELVKAAADRVTEATGGIRP